MTRFTFFAALILLLSGGMLAQTQSFEGYIAAADKASARDDHYNAFRLYSIAADDEWNDDRAYAERIGEVYYKAGTAAYRATAYAKAEEYLVKLQSNSALTKYPLAKYYMGQSVFRQGKYDLAVAYYQQFLDEQPRAPEAYRAAAIAQINDADWAIDALTRSEDITLRHLPEGINTQNSDIMWVRGPKGTRYFSSNDFEFKKDSLTPRRMLSRIMRQTGENTAEALPETINIPGKNVAHTAFNKEMTKVFYSVCDFRNYDEMICDIYRADVSAEGIWSNPVKTNVNQTGYNTTQPSVGYDPDSGETYLFFASDRPEGMGGLDLYRAPFQADGSLGTADNLQVLNSAGDDASPFWYAPRKTLYFATNGRFTFGGMDVHKAFYIDGAFRQPINMGAPVNSAADEAYYSRFDDPNQAYVSSRRPSSEAIYYSEDRDVCCYDIYEFAPDPSIDLQALTFNQLNGKALIGATIQLYKVTPTGLEFVDEDTKPNGNLFYFKVEPGEEYQLKATKDGFTEDLDKFNLSSSEFEGIALIERRLELNPIINLDVFTFNSVDHSDLLGATVKLFEIGPDGKLMLVKEITNPTTNDTHFELEIGKKYKIEGMKPEFGQAYTEIDLTDYTGNEGETIRRDLYIGQQLEIYVIDGRTDQPLSNATIKLKKASGKLVGNDTNVNGNVFYYTVSLDQPFLLSTTREGYYPRENDTLRFTRQDLIDGGGKLVYYVPLYPDIDDFLPFNVYFDNDHPNPNSYSSSTGLAYDETYFPYINRQPEFKAEAIEGLTSEQSFIERGVIDNFFQGPVETGWKQLTRFSEALILHLRSGAPYTVELQGTASPRASTEYNRRLSARRNMSLKNYFRTYKNGILASYIDSKQLSFVEAALGETTANLAKIYERLDRPQESIYSTAASLERRVRLQKPLPSRKK
jgi:tetratricopeptide (TPR) repeat protein